MSRRENESDQLFSVIFLLFSVCGLIPILDLFNLIHWFEIVLNRMCTGGQDGLKTCGHQSLRIAFKNG